MTATAKHPTCETCAHYAPETGYHEGHPIESLATCRATPHGTDATFWDESASKKWPVDKLKPEYANTTAFAIDGSGYHASLSVRPDHYCAMHSALEASK